MTGMRRRHGASRARVVGATAVLAVAAVLGGTLTAGTAGAADAARGVATRGSTATATATGARVRSGDQPVPGASELRSALLTAQDTGLSGSSSGDGGSTGGGGGGGGGAGGGGGTGISGCAALEKVLDAPVGPHTQEADLSGGQTGPLVSEELTAGPAGREAAVYARIKSALASCHRLTLTSGGTRLDLTSTPIRFGGSESAALRMDGELSGVQVNGYMAFGRVGPVLVAYTFFQVESGSSQLASALYQKAVDKVRHVVTEGSGTPV